MEPFAHVQTCLKPYIKTRQEVGHIRRLLAAQVDAQIDYSLEDSRPAALSLPNDSTVLKHSSGIIRGLRKEYIRSLRANIKARQGYDELAKRISTSQKSDSVDKPQKVLPAQSADGYLDTYLALVKQRQRFDRLSILQDYIDALSRKPAASATYLEEAVESGPSALPQVPEDVIVAADPNAQESGQTNLKDLVHDLEKSVLQAKVRSRTQRLALTQLKASLSTRHQEGSYDTTRNAVALEALGRTRNDLIAWVEQELGKTGESDAHEEEERQAVPSSGRPIDQQLARLESQYAQYIKSRQALLNALVDRPDPAALFSSAATTENDAEAESKEALVPMMRVLSPYLETLVNISNEHKALLQQRSHLTVSLSKQYKKAAQTFDRLAEESHLLPAYPMPSTRGPRAGHPLSNEISGVELASTAHRARVWTYAAESAATATMEAVLVGTEEGGLATVGARNVIADLSRSLGRAETMGGEEGDVDGDIWTNQAKLGRSEGGNQPAATEGDMWVALDGNLGLISREDQET